MPQDKELAESARKIDEAKAAAAEEKQTRADEANEDEMAPPNLPQNETDQGFTPS